jgi:hypothetical protein
VILDSYWVSIIDRSVRGVDVCLNQYDPSSTVKKRPDTVIAVNGALALKGEAKHAVSDLQQYRRS